MTPPKTIKSKFALLDVTTSRHRLQRCLTKGAAPIPVTIKGVIMEQTGNDDGTSIEFGVDVASVEIGQ